MQAIASIKVAEETNGEGWLVCESIVVVTVVGRVCKRIERALPIIVFDKSAIDFHSSLAYCT